MCKNKEWFVYYVSDTGAVEKNLISLSNEKYISRELGRSVFFSEEYAHSVVANRKSSCERAA